MLTIDISGFSALSESLCRQGPRGVEALSSLVRHMFGTVIDLALNHGGDVLYFAGARQMQRAPRASSRSQRTRPSSRVPPSSLHRLRAGNKALFAEFRPITAIFMTMPGFALESAEQLAKLQETVAIVQQELHHRGACCTAGSATRALALIALQLGVASGPAYLGESGAARRRGYDAFGSTMVLAARLTSTAACSAARYAAGA